MCVKPILKDWLEKAALTRGDLSRDLKEVREQNVAYKERAL